MDVDAQDASSPPYWWATIRTALLSGVSVAEARIAAALLIDPDSLSGSRALERACGLSRSTVLNTIPAEGESSDLLHAVSRGESGLIDPRPMDVRVVHRHSAGQDANTFSSLGSSPCDESEKVVALVQLAITTYETDKTSETNERARTQAHTRAHGYQRLLDPSRDLWSNSRQDSVGTARAGDLGWVLATVYGPAERTVSYEEVRTLLGLSPRGLSAALRRLESGGWVRRERQAGRWVIRMLWWLLAEPEAEEIVGPRGRQRSHGIRHAGETKIFQRRRTPLGLIAWVTCKERAAGIEQICSTSSPEWVALIESGTEQEIYEHMKRERDAMNKPEPVVTSTSVVASTELAKKSEYYSPFAIFSDS
jgi:hypothetical protein